MPENGAYGAYGGYGGSLGVCLDQVRSWLERYIVVIKDQDLDILALWIVHTWLAGETYTSPRLLIDSPVPGSGKTTLLEHLGKLCQDPIQMASVSSSALLARITASGIRTLLIDEADRSLDPKRDGVKDLVAILNSGYKIGGSRPVLVKGKGDAWQVEEMPTYSPVAIAGNTPLLPEDTRSRCIAIRLMPDQEGKAEQSDWEWIEISALDLRDHIQEVAEQVREQVRTA
jgi:MoxR-like ATPase